MILPVDALKLSEGQGNRGEAPQVVFRNCVSSYAQGSLADAARRGQRGSALPGGTGEVSIGRMTRSINRCRVLSDARPVAARIRKACALRPRLGLVLGSGFQHALPPLEGPVELGFESLPGFPAPRVSGHAGELILGHCEGLPVAILSGRAHYYEGWPMAALAFPIAVLAALGITDLLLTNAAGGINRRYRPGDFMCLADHINFMPDNPLRGAAPGTSSAFLDLSQVYDPRLNGLLRQAARANKVRLHTGVYLAVAGPCYETPAEIRAFQRWGADAVGMSTVPEALVARQKGLAVAGLSCITNVAAGLGPGPITHAEVLARGEPVRENARALLRGFINLYAQPHCVP